MEKIKDILKTVISQYPAAALPGESKSVIPTGIEEFDKQYGGLALGTLTTIASRPGVGKTSFVSNMIVNQAVKDNYGVMCFSLETVAALAVRRLLSIDSGIERSKVISALEDGETAAKSSVDRISRANIYIDDTPSLTIDELKEKARDVVKDHDVKVVYIDYLQLLSVKGMPYSTYTRHDELAYIVRQLKQLAKELSIAIVLVSQLNRNFLSREESKKSVRPELTDLRESGSIEDNSDMVIFLSRPNCDGPEDEEGNIVEGKIYLDVAKNRFGHESSMELKYDAGTGRFSRWNAYGLTAGDVSCMR